MDVKMKAVCLCLIEYQIIVWFLLGIVEPLSLTLDEYDVTLCSMHLTGVDYQGTINMTMSGRRCQRWESQTPHTHLMTDPSLFPESTLQDVKNYCRNPDNTDQGPWCYTLDPDVRREQCVVPTCTAATLDEVTTTTPSGLNQKESEISTVGEDTSSVIPTEKFTKRISTFSSEFTSLLGRSPTTNPDRTSTQVAAEHSTQSVSTFDTQEATSGGNWFTSWLHTTKKADVTTATTTVSITTTPSTPSTTPPIASSTYTMGTDSKILSSMLTNTETRTGIEGITTIINLMTTEPSSLLTSDEDSMSSKAPQTTQNIQTTVMTRRPFILAFKNTEGRPVLAIEEAVEAPGATYIGVFGILLSILFILIVLFADLPTFYKNISYMIKNIKYFRHG